MTLKGSNVSKNTAERGGGRFSGCGSSPVTVTDSTISDNTATAGSGGGIFDLYGTVSLEDSTVSGNTPDNCEPLGAAPGCMG